MPRKTGIMRLPPPGLPMRNCTVSAISIAFWLLLTAASASSDDEASNRAHVVASQFGQCYAKSVPAESYGSKGGTRVYAVTPTHDPLIASFDWYAGQIYLACNIGRPGQQVALSVIRLGPWARGHQASADHLAIAFYFGGKLVKQYSTLDIAGAPGNVSSSVSHYTVFERIDGYQSQSSNFYTFEAVTTAGKRLAFDPTTGDIISTQNHPR